MKTIKISNLQEGDLFIYKDVMYEIVHKDKWETYCKYVNDKSHLGGWFSSEYLYCKFSNYTKVEILDAMSKYIYREVKNYIHNELKLTKEDIKEIMIPIVKEEVKRIFHNTYGNDVDIERWVRCMVSNEIQRHGDYSMIRNLCREIIKEEIADRLSIDISLKKKEG
jgi:hypothetical protein